MTRKPLIRSGVLLGLLGAGALAQAGTYSIQIVASPFNGSVNNGQALNAAGQVAGSSNVYDSSGLYNGQHAFLWSNGQMNTTWVQWGTATATTTVGATPSTPPARWQEQAMFTTAAGTGKTGTPSSGPITR